MIIRFLCCDWMAILCLVSYTRIVLLIIRLYWLWWYVLPLTISVTSEQTQIWLKVKLLFPRSLMNLEAHDVWLLYVISHTMTSCILWLKKTLIYYIIILMILIIPIKLISSISPRIILHSTHIMSALSVNEKMSPIILN